MSRICDITALHPNTSSCIEVVGWKVIQKPTAPFHVPAYSVRQKEISIHITNNWMVLAPSEVLTKFQPSMPYSFCFSDMHTIESFNHVLCLCLDCWCRFHIYYTNAYIWFIRTWLTYVLLFEVMTTTIVITPYITARKHFSLAHSSQSADEHQVLHLSHTQQYIL